MVKLWFHAEKNKPCFRSKRSEADQITFSGVGIMQPPTISHHLPPFWLFKLFQPCSQDQMKALEQKAVDVQSEMQRLEVQLGTVSGNGAMFFLKGQRVKDLCN